MKKFTKRLIFLLLILTPILAFSQSAEKKQKMADKKKEQEKRAAVKEMEKSQKMHMKLQTKDVRKRMKRSAREARRHNDNKKPAFYKRWFKHR